MSEAPREIRFVPELPRTSVGKIRKFLLAEAEPGLGVAARVTCCWEPKPVFKVAAHYYASH
jgi:hypothetical protein